MGRAARASIIVRFASVVRIERCPHGIGALDAS
jgi:hypothetical protein